MKTKINFILLCFLSLNVMGQGIVRRNKPQTTQTQPTKTKTKTKTASKPKPVPEPEAAGYDVTFSCNVSSALLYIDGNAYGNVSGTRFLKTGSHTIKVTAEGYKDYQKSISVNRQNTSCSIALEKKPAPAKPKSGTLNGHDWVDLGLSVKWATCNVGASSPSDYGGYYAWGETSTKSRYDWENLKYRTSGDSYDNVKFSKYVAESKYGTIGNKTTLDLSDDAARANWGSSWRMPTDAENEELCNKCKWSWTSKNGHNGYTVTGPNGNSIFLPAAGFRAGTDSYGVGTSGFYWSSTLSSSISSSARYLYFNSSSHYTVYYYRRYGQSVRPVTE